MADQQAAFPIKEAARLTKLLDIALGVDRFDTGPALLEQFMLDYSANTSPGDPIVEIRAAPMPGCVGALVPSHGKIERWGVLYDENLGDGRRAYTLAHEFGHWILHRKHLTEGVYCSVGNVLRGKGEGIEREADVFAANLLMPLHDFRKIMPSKEKASFQQIGSAANRYGVSLTAAILRWLEFTETRAILVVSTDGYMDWSKASTPAFKSGRFFKTRGTPIELPANSIAASGSYDGVAAMEARQPAGIWFDEPVFETSIRADKWDREITLLHLDRIPVDHDEEVVEDTYDRFMQGS